MPASQHVPGDPELIDGVLPVSTQEDATTAAIAGGDVCNMAEASDAWLTCSTSGVGPFRVATPYGKAVNLVKVELWLNPVYVYVKAGATIPPNNDVIRSAATAGRVDAFVDGTSAVNLRVGAYKAKGNVTPIQGDGVTATTSASAGDLILIRTYSR
ncbi:hypothetical protein [Glutamicibacter sp.]|jgi:hypothetical protein|uniref:hypothetical protein n=1 Tax=Glutamicibacter sp. TaxID=1931995 RepID=UPI002B48F3F1|nr:hypothetical protein [Glutamicibacter sp.]HJX79126.1 hypothetical protein [Glutamicibacter sp.]